MDRAVIIRNAGAHVRIPSIYNAERRRINGYLIDHERFIDGISLGDPCSKNKFYGSDEIFEDFVQHFEGRYGIAIEALEGNGQIYTGDISKFFLLQYLRTPHMVMPSWSDPMRRMKFPASRTAMADFA